MPHARPATDSASTDPPDQGWAHLRARLLRYTLALTRNHHDAEDLAHATIARVLDASAPIHDRHAYAIRTATRLWLDRQRGLRRAVARLRHLADNHRAHSTAQAPDHDQHLAIERAIRTLPPMQHAALVLRLVEELDYPAIAAALDADVGAVRANLHLARKAVRAAIDPRDRTTTPDGDTP